MSVTFNGSTIPGIHEPARFSTAPAVSKRRHYPGLIGESHTYLGQAGRAISIPITIHNSFSTADALTNYLYTLNSLVNQVGTMQTSAPSSRIFTNCSFEGITFSGDPRDGPLNDPIYLDWWQKGTLNFYQLNWV